MTVDREVRPETDPPAAPPADPSTAENVPPATTPQADSGTPPERVSLATMLAYATVAVLLVIWVLFGWLVQQQGFVDSLGEGLGAAFTLLLIVSVVGMVRRNRQD